MRRTDIENAVRRLTWPEPSPDLRARVLTDVTDANQPMAWRARVATPEAPVGQVSIEELPLPRPGRRRWRQVGSVAAAGLLIVLTACAGLDMWAGRQVEAEVARLEARFGSFDERTLAVPAIPSADNRAEIVRAAAALAVPLDKKGFHSLSFPVPLPLTDELRGFAESNQAAIRLVDDVRARRQSNWNIDYRRLTSYPPLESIRILADALYVNAIFELEAGRADNALRLAGTGLAISASLRQEPEVMAQYSRMSDVARRQIEAIREIVSRAEPSADALADVAAWLAENRSPDAMRGATLTALKQINMVFARMERGDIDPRIAEAVYPMSWPDWPKPFLGAATRIGRPFVRQARLRVLHHIGNTLDVLSAPRPYPTLPEPLPPQPWALSDRLAYRFTKGPLWHVTFGEDFSSSLGAAELAVALRRYRLDRGSYPLDLSALVPAYLDQLPINPFTARVPDYSRQGNGFTLIAKGSHEPASGGWALEWNVRR